MTVSAQNWTGSENGEFEWEKIVQVNGLIVIVVVIDRRRIIGLVAQIFTIGFLYCILRHSDRWRGRIL